MKEAVLILQIVYTAIVSGMMLMYVITIGSYFSYILKQNKPEMFRFYSEFRRFCWLCLHLPSYYLFIS